MRFDRGVTLIELLVAMAIVAILAAVAIPSYQDYVRKSRRSDAMASLIQLQLAQEKWRSNNNTYGALANVWSGNDSLDGYYTIAVINNTATGYTATAAPTAGGVQDGDSCGTFAMNQDGPDYTGAYADANCWGK